MASTTQRDEAGTSRCRWRRFCEGQTGVRGCLLGVLLRESCRRWTGWFLEHEHPWIAATGRRSRGIGMWTWRDTW